VDNLLTELAVALPVGSYRIRSWVKRHACQACPIVAEPGEFMVEVPPIGYVHLACARSTLAMVADWPACGRPTKGTGRPCSIPVPIAGSACSWHGGLSAPAVTLPA
jgi:hypothetical protein